MLMTESPLRVTRHGTVLEVVLDRPKANAISGETSRLMGDTFADFRDDADLRVAIVTGGGDRFFSAGWDLKGAAAGEAPDTDYGVGGFGGLQQLPGLNKPVIAAVNGLAVGGGFELALSCDLILASENARFSLPEIRAGTLADAATIKLPRRIPYHVAMDMLYTGRWMEVDEAHRWGLVNEVLAREGLMTRAHEIASMLADGPCLSTMPSPGSWGADSPRWRSCIPARISSKAHGPSRRSGHRSGRDADPGREMPEDGRGRQPGRGDTWVARLAAPGRVRYSSGSFGLFL